MSVERTALARSAARVVDGTATLTRVKFDPKAVIKEVDEVIAECRNLTRHNSAGWQQHNHMAALMSAAITRLAPPGSQYLARMSDVLEVASKGVTSSTCTALQGILEALRSDYATGRLVGVAELIHADVFGDFLEMAAHLLGEGYKDAAVVIAGSTLEGHLRKLCDKHNVPTTEPTGAPRKASTLNAELRKAGAYDLTDDKHVTAWLGLRNAAAHGDYSKYFAGQASLLIEGVRDFIRRRPA